MIIREHGKLIKAHRIIIALNNISSTRNNNSSAQIISSSSINKIKSVQNTKESVRNRILIARHDNPCAWKYTLCSRNYHPCSHDLIIQVMKKHPGDEKGFSTHRQVYFEMTPILNGVNLNIQCINRIHDIWSKTISWKRLVECDIWSIRRFAYYDIWSTTSIGRNFVKLRRNIVENWFVQKI